MDPRGPSCPEHPALPARNSHPSAAGAATPSPVTNAGENHMENHGKTMGKPWENHGKMVTSPRKMGELNGILELIDVGKVGAQKCKFINDRTSSWGL